MIELSKFLTSAEAMPKSHGGTPVSQNQKVPLEEICNT